MWYCIIAKDAPNSLTNRLENRARHLQRLTELQNQGRMLLAGPLPAVDSENPGEAGFLGSVIIAEFTSLAEAESWIHDDIYFKAGVYQSAQVYPFKKALPA